jgi:ATPase subunit of ABC transporter with duplicated ATPase domains
MIMIVSHDRDLLENISNKIWLVKDKKLEIFDDVEEGIDAIVK